jgi:hypothetical protein
VPISDGCEYNASIDSDGDACADTCQGASMAMQPVAQ